MAAATTRIARSSGILALAIGVSRLLGFVRDILLAQLFGTTGQVQAFVVAYRLPNVLRDLVAEGAVTSAFVPVLSWYRAKRAPEEFWKLSQALLARIAVLVLGLAAIGCIGAPWVVRVVAPGFVADPDKFDLTVRLTRIVFPFIALVGLWAFFMGLLNSLKHFAVPGLGPAILNVAMIAACLWAAPRMTTGVVALAWAVMIGGVIQLAVQLPVAWRLGFRFRWRWRHPGTTEVMQLLGPRMVGSAAYQGSVVIDTMLASLAGIVGDGAVAALYYANRLVQLPLALFGTTFAQASLPTLSEQAAHGSLAEFHATLQKVLRMVAFVVIPSAVGLIVLAQPIVGGLFERGLFGRDDTVMTSRALACYAIGLLAFAVSKVMSGAFYALRDTKTPVRLAVESLVLNIALSLLLMWPLKVSGLALAAALSNSVNAYRLTRGMEQRLGHALLGPIAPALARMAAASLFMGAGCWAAWTIASGAHAWLRLALAIAVGGAAYASLTMAWRIEESSRITQWVRQRFPKRFANA